MDPLHFLIFVVRGILSFLLYALVIDAILSWLVAFSVINTRHPFVSMIVRFLDAVTRPMLSPLRRVVPSLGGVDITPLILILIIAGALRYLIPYA